VCQENIPHTITTPPACTVVTRQDGSMFSFCLCQNLTLPSECLNRNRHSDQATFFQSSNVQFWWALANCSFPVCSGDEWYPVGSSAVVAHPPQGCACCGFTNALLHTSVVMSNYFSQSCSSISLINRPIILWPLASTRHFCISFSHHSCKHLEMVVRENPSNWADC